MPDVIVDRRLQGSNRPSPNRAKFLDRHRVAIKQAVKRSFDKDSFDDIVNKKGIKVKIIKDKEPHLDINSKEFDRVFIGNKKYRKGNTIPKPSGGGMGNQAGQDDGSFDPIELELTEAEYNEYLFAELEIPNLTKKAAKDLFQKEYHHAGYINKGLPSNLSIIRSVKNGIARTIAMQAAVDDEIEEIFQRLELLVSPEDDVLITQLRQKLSDLVLQREQVPFLDDMDLRYKFREPRPKPTTKAVMVCMMDYSGSMDDKMKNLAKRFYFLLYLFLKNKYDLFDMVFIRHTTMAEECDGDTFFHSSGTGGTQISSALQLATKIIDERYDPNEYNIYFAQATDDDNWSSDNDTCLNILTQALLPITQYYVHIHVGPKIYREEVNFQRVIKYLMKYYKNINSCALSTPTDVWPEFSRIFKSQGDQE